MVVEIAASRAVAVRRDLNESIITLAAPPLGIDRRPGQSAAAC